MKLLLIQDTFFLKLSFTLLKLLQSHLSQLWKWNIHTVANYKWTQSVAGSKPISAILPSTIETYPKLIITFWKFDLNRLVLTSIAFCCKGTTVASGLPTQLEDFIKNGWFESHKSQTALIKANTNLSLNIIEDSITAGLMR